jgi:hypothetical protein
VTGEPLTPGVNVDKVDVAAGLREAAGIGYASGEHQMVTEYALMRWARGEEDGALRSFLSGGIDLTSAYRIVAAAAAAAAR